MRDTPRRRRVDLKDLEAILREMRRVYRLVINGEMASQTGTRCVFMLQSIGRLHEEAHLEQRITALELER